MFEVQLGKYAFNFGLLVVDMQNGFVSKEGSYDLLGMNTEGYRKIIPKTKELIDFCRANQIPVFYTEAIREPSGIDLLTRVHRLLPVTREERLKVPICVRGTWDAKTIDEIRPEDSDHVVIKRRDSAFQDTEGLVTKRGNKYPNNLRSRYLNMRRNIITRRIQYRI